MEGESPLLKEGALSLQTSLSHRELSHRTPLLQERKFVSLLWWRGSVGKFFCRIGRCGIFCRVRLSHSFCGWEISTKRIQRTNRVRSRTVKKHLPPNQKLSPRAPAKAKRNKLSQCSGGCSWGKFFCCLGRHGFLAGCGYRTLFVGDTFRRYALHECRQAESWHSRKA